MMRWRNYKEDRANKFIISCNNFGLGNRIKCIMTSMHLAYLLERKLLIDWHRIWHCNRYFSELFENNIPRIGRLKSLAIRKGFYFLCNNYIPIGTWRLLYFDNILPKDFSNLEVGNSVDNYFFNVPNDMRERILRIARSFKPVKEVRRRIIEFSRKLSSKTISLSIRTWPEIKERRELLFNQKDIFDIIEDSDNSDFFVSCDDQNFVSLLKKRYKDRIISTDKNRRLGFGMIDARDWVIDLFLLSCNHKLYVSFGSTFGELAWWFGGCSQQVCHIEPTSKIASFLDNSRHAWEFKINTDVRKIVW